jgi:hypothetical protein
LAVSFLPFSYNPTRITSPVVSLPEILIGDPPRYKLSEVLSQCTRVIFEQLLYLSPTMIYVAVKVQQEFFELKVGRVNPLEVPSPRRIMIISLLMIGRTYLCYSLFSIDSHRGCEGLPSPSTTIGFCHCKLLLEP